MMNTQADISVVICAYAEERWDCLLKAIESIRHQTVTPHEIIAVIDHNPHLLHRLQAEARDVIVVENQQTRGLSGGRNTGIAVSQGDVIAFLDDDAEAAPDWLEQLTQWFQSDNVVGVGGTVEPSWEGPAPAWFPKEFRWVVGCSYRGLPEASSRVRNLFGGCMCVRREVFEQVGGFRTSIGRSNGRPMGCEETEFCIRVQQQRPGSRFIYEPRAWAFHRVPAARTTWAYFKSRCYAEGLSKAQVSKMVGTADGLASERSYTFQTLPRGVLKGIGDALTRRDGNGLLRSTAIIGGLTYTVAGYVVGWLNRAKADPQSSLAQVTS
jgi:GT2 family glycosyltransferase